MYNPRQVPVVRSIVIVVKGLDNCIEAGNQDIRVVCTVHISRTKVQCKYVTWNSNSIIMSLKEAELSTAILVLLYFLPK